MVILWTIMTTATSQAVYTDYTHRQKVACTIKLYSSLKVGFSNILLLNTFLKFNTDGKLTSKYLKIISKYIGQTENPLRYH